MRICANRVIESEQRRVALRGVDQMAPGGIRFLRLPDIGVSSIAPVSTSLLALRRRFPGGHRPCFLSLLPLLSSCIRGPTQPGATTA